MDTAPETVFMPIKEFDRWIWFLHSNQYFLGRTYLWAKRSNAKDILEMTEEEWIEFKRVGKFAKNAVIKAFHPDLFNYAALGNVAFHLHIHIIPRYIEVRIFEHIQFIDRYWGKNYSPYDKNFTVPKQIHEKIAQLLLDNICFLEKRKHE